MKIAELFKKKMTLSFEVFPPKNETPMDGVLNTLSRLYKFKPDFISCTCGAGGSDRGRNIEVCSEVIKSGNTVMPHFTCIGSSRDDIKKTGKEYVDMGIENTLAIRGDIPDGWECTRGDFSHADNLIGFLKHEFPGMCVAAAGYPEKHLTAPSPEADITRLRSKQDKGAEFIITQLCHDVPAFERFLIKIRKAGITVPVVAGIMPALARDPIIRMTIFNGCSIPAELAAILGKYQNDPEGFSKAGAEYTVLQIHRYINAGVNGLHLYSMNKWEKLSGILEAAGIA